MAYCAHCPVIIILMSHGKCSMCRHGIHFAKARPPMTCIPLVLLCMVLSSVLESTSAAPPFASIQSPPSPLSPTMFIQSPYASSVSSCPSISSSSGYSSENTSTSKRYAPSEYYIGPIKPLSEKIADEDKQREAACDSGRNTPTDSPGEPESDACFACMGSQLATPSSCI